MLEVRPRKANRGRRHRLRISGWRIPLALLYLSAAGLLAAGGLAVYKSRPAAANSNRILISAGRGFVRDVIREDLSTAFSSDEETRIEALPDHRFLVAGWVDTITKSGVASRQSYSCVLYKDGDIWASEKVAVIPQP